MTDTKKIKSEIIASLKDLKSKATPTAKLKEVLQMASKLKGNKNIPD